MLLTITQWLPTSKICMNFPTGVPIRWPPIDSNTDILCRPSTSGNCSFSIAQQWSIWTSVNSWPLMSEFFMYGNSDVCFVASATGIISPPLRVVACVVPWKSTSSTSWGVSNFVLLQGGSAESVLVVSSVEPEDSVDGCGLCGIVSSVEAVGSVRCRLLVFTGLSWSYATRLLRGTSASPSLTIAILTRWLSSISKILERNRKHWTKMI